MSALSRAEVLSRTKDRSWAKRLVVEPNFTCSNDAPTTAASLDFHLGNRFKVFRRRRNVMHNPLSHEITRLGTTHNDESLPMPDAEISTREFFVPFGEHFVVHPGHVVLGTTLEWFRLPVDMMAYVVGRSIWGRRGLLVATATDCATWLGRNDNAGAFEYGGNRPQYLSWGKNRTAFLPSRRTSGGSRRRTN